MKKHIKKFLLCLILFSWTILPIHGNNFTLPPLSYEQLQKAQTKIALTVNDEPITYKDILARIKLIQFMSHIKPTPQTNNAMVPQAIHALIDQTIRLQTIEENEIPTEIDAYQDTLSMIARDQGKTVSQLKKIFQEKGIPFSSFEKQIIAYKGWERYAREQFARNNINVSEKEIALKRTELILNAGKNKYLLAEILLSPNGYASEADLEKEAYKIIEELKKGADFIALARQFSDGSTALRGGNLGWVRQGELSSPLDEALLHLDVGAISRPIRDGAGYHILYLRDRQQTPPIPANEIMLDLIHLWAPFDPNKNNDFERKNALLDRIKRKASNCELLTKIAKKEKNNISFERKKIKQSELPTLAQLEIASTFDEKPTATLSAENNLDFYMVCNRNSANPSIPSDDQIYYALSQKKLDTLQRRLFRDAYHAAYIDVRYDR